MGNQTLSLPGIKTIFSIGCPNSHFEFSFPDRSPMRSSTLQINPFLFLLTPIILVIGPWFFETLTWYTITISPILKFLFLSSHFWNSWKDWRYFSLHWDGNSLQMSWMHCQPFLQYISGLENAPGGGETIFDLWLGCSQVTMAVDLLEHLELLLRSIRSQMFFKIDVLENSLIFTGKNLYWSLFSKKMQIFRPAMILKRDFNTGIFLWTLQSFKNNVLHRTPLVAAYLLL